MGKTFTSSGLYAGNFDAKIDMILNSLNDNGSNIVSNENKIKHMILKT